MSEFNPAKIREVLSPGVDFESIGKDWSSDFKITAVGMLGGRAIIHHGVKFDRYHEIPRHGANLLALEMLGLSNGKVARTLGISETGRAVNMARSARGAIGALHAPRSLVVRSLSIGMLEVAEHIKNPPTLNHDHQNIVRLIAWGESEDTLRLSRPGHQPCPDSRTQVANLLGIPDSDQSVALYGFLSGIVEPPEVSNPPK